MFQLVQGHGRRRTEIVFPVLALCPAHDCTVTAWPRRVFDLNSILDRQIYAEKPTWTSSFDRRHNVESDVKRENVTYFNRP